jgi:fumarylacetoacetase
MRRTRWSALPDPYPIDATHDPALRSWVPGADTGDFPIQNLPYGVFSHAGAAPRPGVAIGDRVLCLRGAAEHGLVPYAGLFGGATLNALLALPLADRLALRRRLSSLLSDKAYRPAVEALLVPLAECTMHLPAAIGDFTDFYVGIHHATRVGQLFRPDAPLLPNYKWVPIGYHGRASSVRPSGIPVRRPLGQRRAAGADTPVVGPSERLDFELELGIWIGRGNVLGEPVPIDAAPGHVAGFCLLNDWSARDLQAWEYQPLGPFLAKSFHTTVSPWVVTPEALAPFRRAQPPRGAGDPPPLPYLHDGQDQKTGALSIELEASLSTQTMRGAGLAPYRLTRVEAREMYWTVAQIVTHHASNGCDLRPGDLIGTGTISGPDDGSLGSLLEIARGGASPITLPSGEQRAFLADGDEITLSARAVADGRVPIGFGACHAIVDPAPGRWE